MKNRKINQVENHGVVWVKFRDFEIYGVYISSNLDDRIYRNFLKELEYKIDATKKRLGQVRVESDVHYEKKSTFSQKERLVGVRCRNKAE